MVRIVLVVALLFLLAACDSGTPGLPVEDPPVEDPPSSSPFYPLAVGNVWEYESRAATSCATFGEVFGYRRLSVEEEVTAGGEQAYRIRTERFDAAGNPSHTLADTIRYDAETSRVIVWRVSDGWEREIAWPEAVCPFNAEPGSVVECALEHYSVSESMGWEGEIGGTSVSGIWRRYGALEVITGWREYVEGLGLVSYGELYECVGERRDLRYAAVGDREVGESVLGS